MTHSSLAIPWRPSTTTPWEIPAGIRSVLLRMMDFVTTFLPWSDWRYGGEGESDYIDQFLFHLVGDGHHNRRWQALTPEQRRFVGRLLGYLLEYRAEQIEMNGSAELLLQAIDIWSHPSI